MTETYQIDGMTCQGCVATVQQKISEFPGVEHVSVSFEEKIAVIQGDHLPSREALHSALKESGKYGILNNPSNEDGVENVKVSTYKPLIMIFIYLLSVSAISAGIGTSFNLYEFMRYFMAGFFLTFSFFKFLDLPAFASSYAMYDLLASKVRVYGYIYPFLELLLGLAYLIDFDPQITNIATITIMGFSIIGVIRSVVNKRKIQCACLGTVFNLPMTTVTIIEDLLMVGMAVFMLLN